MERGKIYSYKDLEIWKRSVLLTSEIYKITKAFPKDEQYGIISQIRRASVSVPANIAEGWGRESSKSFALFLKTARGSLFELDTLVTIAYQQQYLSLDNKNKLEKEFEEIGRMVNSLLKKIELKNTQ
jgi:four helix bundle protein